MQTVPGGSVPPTHWLPSGAVRPKRTQKLSGTGLPDALQRLRRPAILGQSEPPRRVVVLVTRDPPADDGDGGRRARRRRAAVDPLAQMPDRGVHQIALVGHVAREGARLSRIEGL